MVANQGMGMAKKPLIDLNQYSPEQRRDIMNTYQSSLSRSNAYGQAQAQQQQ